MKRRAFVQYDKTEVLDVSLLMMPLVAETQRPDVAVGPGRLGPGCVFACYLGCPDPSDLHRKESVSDA